METPVQDVIIGNIPGALWVEPTSQIIKVNVTVKSNVNDTQESECEECRK